MEKQRVIAVDFDGCLCDNAYPHIGAPNWRVIEAALKERADGAALILWTCREGDMLQQALDACKGWGLEFDAVNDSLHKWKETWKNDPRKIGATEYWDDKAVRMPNIDPATAAAEELAEKQNEAYDRGYQYGMNYSGRRWTEAFEIGYQSCLHYKGLRWDEAEELQRYREIGSIDRLRELAQAEKEGRLVVLPCKVGDAVWKIYDDCEFPVDCGTKMRCKGCEYRNLFIEEQEFCLSMLSQNGKLEHPYYTRKEAAEAALEDGKIGDEAAR